MNITACDLWIHISAFTRQADIELVDVLKESSSIAILPDGFVVMCSSKPDSVDWVNLLCVNQVMWNKSLTSFTFVKAVIILTQKFT